MDEPNNNDLISQDSQPVAANDAAEINVANSQAEVAPEILASTDVSNILVDMPAESAGIPQTPEANPADNIIFTPEDYQKMTGGPEDNDWQSVSPAPMPQVEPFPESPMDTPVLESTNSSTPSQPAETPQGPQTIFAPVPMEATEHYEEPASNIPNPESFYVGYKPAPPVQPAPSGLEKRISQVSAEQAAKNKKLLIITVSIVLSVLLIGGGGVFGYIAYQKSASQKILTTAWQNFQKATEVSTNVSLGYDNNSIDAKFDVDKDSDIRFKLDVREFPIEFVYISKTDKLYIYDIAATAEGATTTTSTKSWIEVSNTKKALTNYAEKTKTSEQASLGTLFGSDYVKYFKKESSEIIDGVDSYKYVFAPPAEVMEGIVNQIKSQDAFKDLDFKASDFKVEMWIAKKDNKFTKIKVTAGFDFGVQESEKTYSGSLELKFKYGFKEDIKTTTRTKISQKIDLSKQLEDLINSGNFLGGQSDNVNAADESNIALTKELQVLLEAYYAKNESYPDSTNITELVELFKDENTLNSDQDFSGFKYTHTANPEGYMVMFKLADQNYSGENVIGESPDKYYALTAKQ